MQPTTSAIFANQQEDKSLVQSQAASEKNKPVPMLDSTKEILHQLEIDLINQILGDKKEEGKVSSSLFNKIIEICPGAKKIGEVIGWTAGMTYSTTVSNEVVTYAAPKILPSYLCGRGMIEGFKMGITPHLAPWLTVFTTAFGGISLPAAMFAATWLYGKLVNSEPNLDVNNLPPLDQLMQWSEKDNAYVDATGRIFTKHDFNVLFFLVNQFELIQKLKTCNAEEAEILINEYLKAIEEPRKAEFSFANHTQKLKKIELAASTAINEIKGHNYLGVNGIKPAIELLAYNIRQIDSSNLCYKYQQIHAIDEAFAQMKNFLTLPDSKANDRYEYNQKTGQLCLSGNFIYRWYYGITGESTGKAIEESMGANLSQNIEKIKEAIDSLNEVDDQVLEYINAQFVELEKDYKNFYSKISETANAEIVKPYVHNIINDYVNAIEVLKKKLSDKQILKLTN